MIPRGDAEAGLANQKKSYNFEIAARIIGGGHKEALGTGRDSS